ncbi:MAG: ferredoxin [Oscillospiraceae bacterium]|jgi:ferredoxin
MKATLDKTGCIACGLCVDTCPEVFRMGEDGLAEVYLEEIPKDAEKNAEEAREGCPVSVITIE